MSDLTNEDATNGDETPIEESAVTVVDGPSDESTGDPNEVVGALVTDGVWSLLIADFADPELAAAAYAERQDAADANLVSIEAAFVVAKNENGELTVEKATDRRTPRGLRWGLVAGAIAGVFFPPPLLGSLAVGGALGAGIGRLRHKHYAGQFADEVSDAVDPGHSGLVLLAYDPVMDEFARSLARAEKIAQLELDQEAVDELTDEVNAAEKAEPSDADGRN